MADLKQDAVNEASAAHRCPDASPRRPRSTATASTSCCSPAPSPRPQPARRPADGRATEPALAEHRTLPAAHPGAERTATPSLGRSATRDRGNRCRRLASLMHMIPDLSDQRRHAVRGRRHDGQLRRLEPRSRGPRRLCSYSDDCRQPRTYDSGSAAGKMAGYFRRAQEWTIQNNQAAGEYQPDRPRPAHRELPADARAGRPETQQAADQQRPDGRRTTSPASTPTSSSTAGCSARSRACTPSSTSWPTALAKLAERAFQLELGRPGVQLHPVRLLGQPAQGPPRRRAPELALKQLEARLPRPEQAGAGDHPLRLPAAARPDRADRAEADRPVRRRTPRGAVRPRLPRPLPAPDQERQPHDPVRRRALHQHQLHPHAAQQQGAHGILDSAGPAATPSKATATRGSSTTTARPRRSPPATPRTTAACSRSTSATSATCRSRPQGVVSRWQISMPPACNAFDFDTITDVVIKLSYTARDGGDLLRSQAFAAAKLPALPQQTGPAANSAARRRKTIATRLFSAQARVPDRVVRAAPPRGHRGPVRADADAPDSGALPLPVPRRKITTSDIEVFVILKEPPAGTPSPPNPLTVYITAQAAPPAGTVASPPVDPTPGQLDLPQDSFFGNVHHGTMPAAAGTTAHPLLSGGCRSRWPSSALWSTRSTMSSSLFHYNVTA